MGSLHLGSRGSRGAEGAFWAGRAATHPPPLVSSGPWPDAGYRHADSEADGGRAGPVGRQPARWSDLLGRRWLQE